MNSLAIMSKSFTKAKKRGANVLIVDLICNRKSRIRYHTQQCDDTLLKHLNEYGGLKLSLIDVDSDFCRGFASYLINSGKLRLSSVKLYLQKLHAILQDAVYEGVLDSNPMPPISRLVPKYVSIEKESLTVEEINRLYDIPCRHRITGLAFLFSIFTGLRLSDIETLRWENIISKDGNFMLKKIQVKTSNEVRIPLCGRALKILKQIQNSHLDKDGNVFPLYSRTITAKDLILWANTAGIHKHITFHVSRVSFVTLSLSANVNIVVISKLCGHTNIKTTQIYAKIVDNTFESAVGCLESLFTRKHHKAIQSNKIWNNFNLL